MFCVILLSLRRRLNIMTYLKISLLFLLIGHSGGAQEYQSKYEVEHEILGTWQYETDPRTKITFSDDGVVKRYFGDELHSTGTYEITSCCDGEELPDNQFFLKENGKDGTSFCSYIEGVNFNNNEFFTVMTRSRGKIIVLIKAIPEKCE